MPSFEDFAVSMKKQYRLVFQAGDELPELANQMFRKFRDDKQHKVLRALSMIVVSDFQALLVLCVNGFGLQAAKIARTMFEASVNIRYLLKFPHEIDNFVDFHQFSNKLFFDHLVEFAPEQAALLPAADVQETKEIYERIKSRFPDRPPAWTKKSLLTRAKEGGSTVLYWMLYPNLSGMVHGDIRAILTNSNDATMTVDQPPSTKWIEPALAIGHHAVFMALADYNELCGFGYDLQMRAIHTAYDRAWPQSANG